MTFVETVCGHSVRVDSVQEVRCSQDDDTIAVLRLEGGGERKVSWDNWSMAEWAQSRETIPAQPGTSILHTNDEGKLTGREPVIGWAIGRRGFTRPITAADRSFNTDDDPLIEHPDGTVQDLGGIFESYDQWLEQLVAEKVSRLVSPARSARPN